MLPPYTGVEKWLSHQEYQSNSKAKGELSEAIILAQLMKLGWAVSLPFGNNQRYDMILDSGETLIKAQCKTGRLQGGCVCFAVSSANGFTHERKSYHGEVEVILVYSPDLDTVYWVPINIVGTNECRLRVERTKGRATNGIKWASEYVLNSASGREHLVFSYE